MTATRRRRHRHRLGVHRLPADGGRLPARRPGDPAGPPARLARPDRLGDRRRSSSVARSSSTCCSAGRRDWLAGRGSPSRSRAAWLHVLFWAGLRGAVAVAMALVAAGRRPAARAAPGDHLRGRPVHAARPGDDGRLGRRPDDRRSADATDAPASAGAADDAPLATAEQPSALGPPRPSADSPPAALAQDLVDLLRGSSGRSAPDRATRCTRCPSGRPRRATSRRTDRSSGPSPTVGRAAGRPPRSPRPRASIRRSRRPASSDPRSSRARPSRAGGGPGRRLAPAEDDGAGRRRPRRARPAPRPAAARRVAGSARLAAGVGVVLSARALGRRPRASPGSPISSHAALIAAIRLAASAVVARSG